jgi:hypothetical protein
MKTGITKAMVMAITLLLAGGASADLPPEAACWDTKEVAQTVTRDTVGTLQIGTRLNGLQAIPTYAQRGEAWVHHRDLGVVQETLPLVSMNCMRAPAWGFAAGGWYPVVAVQGDHLQVVVDPVQDWRVWISRPEIEKGFYVEVRLDKNTPAVSTAPAK